MFLNVRTSRVKPLMLGKRVIQVRTNSCSARYCTLETGAVICRKTADRLLTVDTANLTRDTANRQMELGHRNGCE